MTWSKRVSEDISTANVRIGDLLEQASLVTSADLAEAVSVSKRLQIPIGRVLIMSGCVTEKVLRAAIDAQSLLRDRGISVDKAVETLAIVARNDMPFMEALKQTVPAYVSGSCTNRLGEILIEFGLITEDQLHRALQKSVETGVQLGTMLVSMNLLSPTLLPMILNTQEKIRNGSITRQQAAAEFKKSYSMWSKAKESFKGFGSGGELQSQSSPVQQALGDPYNYPSEQSSKPDQPMPYTAQAQSSPKYSQQQLGIPQTAAPWQNPRPTDSSINQQVANASSTSSQQPAQTHPRLAYTRLPAFDTQAPQAQVVAEPTPPAPQFESDQQLVGVSDEATAAFESIISRKLKSQTSDALPKVEAPKTVQPTRKRSLTISLNTPAISSAEPSQIMPNLAEEEVAGFDTLIDYEPHSTLSAEPFTLDEIGYSEITSDTGPSDDTLIDYEPLPDVQKDPKFVVPSGDPQFVETLIDYAPNPVAIDAPIPLPSEAACAKPLWAVETLFDYAPATSTQSESTSPLADDPPAEQPRESSDNETGQILPEQPTKGSPAQTLALLNDIIDTHEYKKHSRLLQFQHFESDNGHKASGGNGHAPVVELPPTSADPEAKASSHAKQRGNRKKGRDKPLIEILKTAGYFTEKDLTAALTNAFLDSDSLPELLVLLKVLSPESVGNLKRCQVMMADGGLEHQDAAELLRSIKAGKTFDEAADSLDIRPANTD
jgi:hypothetical protein